ncbi:MAG: hypothetical protein NTX24_05340 [Candidatus Pacearchaeota archaeon]|nr:hypothetical protein [Candidatus Pacearchaeota archaeon]
MKKNILILLFAIIFFFSVTIVFADHIVKTSTGGDSFSVNQTISNLFNISVNNTDATEDLNITTVSINLSSSFTFVAGSNGTDAGSHTFSNVSNVLSWTNNGLVMNNTLKYFWFNASISVPGTYNITIITINSTGWSINSYLNVTVNDTIAPIASGTNPIDNYNSSSSTVYFNISCSDNYNVSWIQLWTNTTGTWAANYSNWSYTNNTWLNVTVTGINESRNYKWMVYCNDSAGRTNITTNRTFSFSALNASQGTNPVNGYNSTNSSITFDFKCSDSYNVSTIQLWTNINGTWQANYTNSSYINNTWLNITIAEISQGLNYNWTVWCNNTNGSTNITTNRTFLVDTTNPVVTSVAPEEDAEYNLTSGGTRSVTFIYNVTDNLGIKNCSLYIEDSIVDSQYSSIGNGTNETELLYIFSNDDSYQWKVGCFDYSGRSHNSSSTTIIINPYSSSSSGGSSGGSSDDTEDNCPPNEKRCSGGNVEQCLNDEWKVVTNCSYGCNTANFTCKTLSESAYSGNNLTYLKNKTFDYLEINETIDFILDNSTRTIFIKNITNSSVTLEINSTVITTTLAVNETKTFDLNGNGHDDFSVTLVSIVDDTATLLLNSIEEPKTGGLLGSKPFLNFDFGVFTRTLVEWKWYILIFLGVVVAVFVAIIIVKKKKKSGKFAYVKINNKFVKIKKRQDGGIRIEKNGNVS